MPRVSVCSLAFGFTFVHWFNIHENCGSDNSNSAEHTHSIRFDSKYRCITRYTNFQFLILLSLSYVRRTFTIYTLTKCTRMQSYFDGDCSPHNDRINIKIVLHGTRGDDKIPNALVDAENKIETETSYETDTSVTQKKRKKNSFTLYAWRLDAPLFRLPPTCGVRSVPAHTFSLFARVRMDRHGHTFSISRLPVLQLCESTTLVPEFLNSRRARDIYTWEARSDALSIEHRVSRHV